jgi:hypothetical protein
MHRTTEERAHARHARTHARTHGTFGPVVPGARIGVLEEYARKTRTTSHLRVLHLMFGQAGREELAGRPAGQLLDRVRHRTHRECCVAADAFTGA